MILRKKSSGQQSQTSVRNAGILFALCLGSLLWVRSAHAQSESLSVNKQQQFCTDRRLGISFYCDLKWDIQQAEDAVLVVMSTDPMVTMIIAKIDSPVMFIGQLSRKILNNMNQYADGFVVEHVSYMGQPFMKVKALAKTDPDRRILDHYFIHQGKLFGVLFSVKPAAQWDVFKHLIEKVLQSMSVYNKI